MSFVQPIKHLVSSLSQNKCTKNNCKSSGRSSLDIVWFGKQYQTKQMTCSSCFVLNDQAIKKSLPTQFNVLPLIKFNDKLLEEYRSYEEKKKSTLYHPLVVKQRNKQLLSELTSFETKLNNSLSSLILALNEFLKKVEQKNKEIHHNETMSEIIELNKLQTMPFQTLLQKINTLVQHLNFSQTTNNYEFERVQIRNKKLEKEREKINEVITKVNAVLNNLLTDIKKRNESIGKV